MPQKIRSVCVDVCVCVRGVLFGCFSTKNKRLLHSGFRQSMNNVVVGYGGYESEYNNIQFKIKCVIYACDRHNSIKKLHDSHIVKKNRLQHVRAYL